jgi:hypothetical protein
MRLKTKAKTKALMAAFILLAVPAVQADYVLSMYYVFHKNGSVELKQMNVIDGQRSMIMPPGEYNFIVTGAKDGYPIYSENRAINFLVLSDPPREADKETVSMRIPYARDMKNINVYKGSKLLYSKSLDLCNSDGICDKASETYLSCPEDCPQDKPDPLCAGASDGVCDPECATGVDSDCADETKTSATQDELGGSQRTNDAQGNSPDKPSIDKRTEPGNYLYLALLILAVAVICFIAYLRLKG